MNIRRKQGLAAVLLAAALFLLQSCATIVRGTTQKIPVTSVPIGAKVIVDGKDVGTAPLTLRLKRKSPAVIRIEKEGYNPREIRIIRNKPDLNAAIPGNLMLGPFVGGAIGIRISGAKDIDEIPTGVVLLSAFLTTAAFVAVDLFSGTAYSLYPEYFKVVLTPVGAIPRLEISVIDEARLRNVKWLRIRAAGPQDRD